jgi:hypothetical protein
MGRSLARTALFTGAIAGVVVLYLGMVGMIERLDDLTIIGRIGMDSILIFLPAAVGGWVVTRPRVVAGERRTATPAAAAATGAMEGLVAGGMVELGLAVVAILGIETVRQVFSAVSPALIEIMRFHMEPVPAAIVMIAGATFVGAGGRRLAGAPQRDPHPDRRGTCRDRRGGPPGARDRAGLRPDEHRARLAVLEDHERPDLDRRRGRVRADGRGGALPGRPAVADDPAPVALPVTPGRARPPAWG